MNEHRDESVEQLRQKRVPHGALKSCTYHADSMGMAYNSNTLWEAEVTRKKDRSVILLRKKEAFHAEKTKKIWPKTDVFAAIEAFVEKENLAALADLRCKPSPFQLTDYSASASIQLVFGDPAGADPFPDRTTIDIKAMRDHGFGDLADALRQMIEDAIAKTEKKTEQEVPLPMDGNPWNTQQDSHSIIDDLLRQREPHGPLVGCAFRRYARPNIPMQLWNNDESYWIGVDRRADGEVLTVIEKPRGGSRVTVEYRPAEDVLPKIEAFVERENLAALAALDCPCMLTGGELYQIITLLFADPDEEKNIDCLALDQYGRRVLSDTVYALLTGAVKTATVLSRTETPIISPEATALLQQPKEPHGALTSCAYRRDPFFDGTKLCDFARTVAAARTADGVTVTVEDKGQFQHGAITVYRPVTDVLAELEALVDGQNLLPLSALGQQQSMAFLGALGGMTPSVNAIDLTFAPAPDGAPGLTKRLNAAALQQNGLGHLVEAVEKILSAATENAEVLSAQKEVNERVWQVEQLRQQEGPRGTLQQLVYDCHNPGSGPSNESYYHHEIARTDTGTLLTADEKAQYRNKTVTVYQPADDVFAQIETFCKKENLAVFAALQCSEPPFWRVVTKITLTYDDPAATIAVDADALREYGLGHLADTLHQILTDAKNQSPVLSRTWDCQVCGSKANTGDCCPACGSRQDIVITKPANAQAKAADSAEGWACPICGTKNKGKFCNNCGTPRP